MSSRWTWSIMSESLCSWLNWIIILWPFITLWPWISWRSSSLAWSRSLYLGLGSGVFRGSGIDRTSLRFIITWFWSERLRGVAVSELGSVAEGIRTPGSWTFEEDERFDCVGVDEWTSISILLPLIWLKAPVSREVLVGSFARCCAPLEEWLSEYCCAFIGLLFSFENSPDYWTVDEIERFDSGEVFYADLFSSDPIFSFRR